MFDSSGTRLTRRTQCLIVGLLCLVGGIRSGSAQEIGIEYGSTWAGYGEALERPTGWTGIVDLPLHSRIALRLSVAHYTENRTLTASPCTGLVPPGTDCSDRRFDGDAHLTNYALGPAVKLPSPVASLQPTVYVLGVLSDVEATFVAQSGTSRRTVILPDGLTPGIAFGAHLSYDVTRYLAVTSRLGGHFFRSSTCATDAWDPFCESRVLEQLAFGTRLRPTELFE